MTFMNDDYVLKNEKCSFEETIEDLTDEIKKRILLFKAESISKSTFHLPLYNNSSSSNVLL